MFRVFAGVFYKEFIKTRFCLLMLAAGSLAFMGWIWLGVHRLFLLDHPEIVWYRVMDLGQIPYSALTFFPAVCACTFCGCQFLPEMRDERLRISLHLPCGMAPLILAHLLFGFVFLFLLYLLDILLLLSMMGRYFPHEAVFMALATCLPWFLAGFYAYLCTACAILEPQKKAKLMGVMLGIGFCAPLLSRAAPGVLAPCLPYFALLLPLLLVGLLLPSMNFRHRKVQ